MSKHVSEFDGSERKPIEPSVAEWKTPSPVGILQSRINYCTIDKHDGTGNVMLGLSARHTS